MKHGAVSIHQVLGRHAVHPFPARMAPGLVLNALNRLDRPATVLDPMAGSGTVLAIARAKGHRTIGFDVDPLAVLLARVWTRTLDAGETRRQAARVLKRAIELASDLGGRDAYPIDADEETRAFTRYWFDDGARRQLAGLARTIKRVRDETIREALWCSFSRLIIAKQAGVSLALDLAHSRPHRSFDRAPRRPFELFLECVDRVIKGCVHPGAAHRGPISNVSIGDVRAMPVAERSVDLVFTSPPYLNAIDYLRCSKFSLIWMGYSVAALRDIRSQSIGAEVRGSDDERHRDVLEGLRLRPALPQRMNGILYRYVEDTGRALGEVARVLAPKGRAVYVVGENTIRGTYVPTGRLVARMASAAGLRLLSRRYRDLPANRRYLPPPGVGITGLDARMRREVILTFERRTR